MTDEKLNYMDALGMFQRAIREITAEDVADAINETFDPIKIIEIQDLLYLHRQHFLEAELKELQQRGSRKKGGRA